MLFYLEINSSFIKSSLYRGVWATVWEEKGILFCLFFDATDLNVMKGWHLGWHSGQDYTQDDAQNDTQDDTQDDI